MDSLFEEYGFVMITAVCAVIMSVVFNNAIAPDGFIGEMIINFAKSIIGG